jgi:hypothetical protein
MDHQQLREEYKANPRFGMKLERMLSLPGGARLIDDSAKRAVLNELDGSHPESKGEWTVLRRRFNAIIRSIPKSIEESVSKLSLQDKTRMLEAYAHGGVQVHAQMAEYPVESLGQYAEIIGAVVSAASAVYSAKLQSTTQKQIAKIRAAGEARSLDANMTLAKAQMALQAAQVKSLEQQTAAIQSGNPLPSMPSTPGAPAVYRTPGAPGSAGGPGASGDEAPSGIMSVVTKDIGGGVPLVVPVVGVLGTILYFVFKG